MRDPFLTLAFFGSQAVLWFSLARKYIRRRRSRRLGTVYEPITRLHLND